MLYLNRGGCRLEGSRMSNLRIRFVKGQHYNYGLGSRDENRCRLLMATRKNCFGGKVSHFAPPLAFG